MSPEQFQQVLELQIELITPGPIEDRRAIFDAWKDRFPTPDSVTLERVAVQGVSAEWARPAGVATDRAILFLHGGGYVLGSSLSHRHLAAALADASGAPTLALDYRLAPEHPFPAALEDALAGYRFLLDAGFAPGRIAIAGDSAGGGLTVATLVNARDAQLPQPSCAFCMSPWVDLEGLGDSMTTKAGIDPMALRLEVAKMASAYLGGASPRTPLAAPLWASLEGIAPLLIHVGSGEFLLDDAIRLAARAAAAGVDVRLECWPKMMHVWHEFFPILSEGRDAIASAGAYIAHRMG